MKLRQVHLDFHTGEAVPAVGQLFDAAQFQQMLQLGHVDSITLFSKCHHGWSYHPTAVNEMHPSLHFDLLGAQLAACAAIGVRAPVYISAGLDEKYAVRHPEWLIRARDESTTWAVDFDHPGFHRLCFNSGYLPRLLAQIAEVMERYRPVEIFLDICTPQPCLCASCRASMKQKGLDPANDDDVMRQAEDTYAEYARQVRETVDRYDPSCAVIHNFGHLFCGRRDLADTESHLELESLPTGGWGYDDYPFSASYAETLKKPYLGMTGKFHKSWGEFGGFKHPNALRYETSLSAALGAGCSVGDQLHPDGLMDPTTYALIGAAYGELEQKEPWLTGTAAVADVGLLSSEAVGVSNGRRLARTADIGANRILLEGKYLYSVIDTESDFSAFKVLVLPDRCRLGSALADKLADYIRNGGKVLCSGESGLRADRDEFAAPLGIEYRGKNGYQPTYLVTEDLLKTNNGVLLMYGQSHCFELRGAEPLAWLQNPYFNRTAEHFCSHQHAPNDLEFAGPGAAATESTAYIGWEIFTDYATEGSLQCKELVCAALDRLLGEKKTLRCGLPDRGVTTLRFQPAKNRYIHHLLFAHTSRRGKDVEVIEDLVPVCDTACAVRLPVKPKTVKLQPQNADLPFAYADGELRYTLPRFTCHQMIEIAL